MPAPTLCVVSTSVLCAFHTSTTKIQSARRIRDYDNLECKQILDTVAAFLMKDDSGLLCDVYHCTQFGTEDCTILTIMEKSYFSKWLKAHENAAKYLSDFPSESG